MAHKFEGKKYNANMRRAEVKAAILADLKAAVKAGDLPRCSPTVREGGGAGTMSLTITLRDLAVPLLRPEHVRCDVLGSCDCPETSGLSRTLAVRYTAAAHLALDTAEQIAEAYNFDDSDIQTDYFHCGFYLHMSLGAEQQAAEHVAIMNAASPLRAGAIATLRSVARPACDEALEAGKTIGSDFAKTLARTELWSLRGWLAKATDKFYPTAGAVVGLAAVEAKLIAGEDWNTAAGAAAQAALYPAPAAKKAPKVTTAAPAIVPQVILTPAQRAWATRRARAAAKAVAS